MNTKILLRIAAILILIHAIGHSFGLAGWKKSSNPVQAEVITQMTSHSFPFMGRTHSFGDSFDGFGYAATIGLVLMASILWLVAKESINPSELSKRIVSVIGFSLLIWGIDELIYFFPFAAWTSLIASMLTLFCAYKVFRAKSMQTADKGAVSYTYHQG